MHRPPNPQLCTSRACAERPRIRDELGSQEEPLTMLRNISTPSACSPLRAAPEIAVFQQTALPRSPSSNAGSASPRRPCLASRSTTVLQMYASRESPSFQAAQ
jgi:hypothetical protein